MFERNSTYTMNNYYDKEPVLGESKGMRIKEHLKKGFSTFLIVLVCMLCFLAILKIQKILEVIGLVIRLLRPVIYGIAIAYILNPIVVFVEKHVSKVVKRVIKKENKVKKVSRGIGIFAALLFALAIISALFMMLIPELIRSVEDLIEKMPGQITKFMDYIHELRKGDGHQQKLIEAALVQGSDALQEWAKKSMFTEKNILVVGITELTAGVIEFLVGLLDIVIGIIVSIYALYSKEEFLGQGRKILYALFTPKRANYMLHVMRKSNSIFGGFIIGKIIDSAIIGVLCFIGVSILRMPYALLVSVFVGVTNVIPYFGPFIGAIPSALLIMIVDPVKGLYFIIFIFLLQQLDGNVIGPKILGDSTGLSAFWVLFSILLFGGLFGVLGMIIGVPLFAVIYYMIKLYVSQKLKEKKLPLETEFYNGENYVDDDGNYVEHIDTQKATQDIEEQEGE